MFFRGHHPARGVARGIDEQQKSITFEIISNMVSGNDDLELRLPSELLDGPFVIWIDDQKLSDFEYIQDGSLNVLFVPLDADSKTITVVGTSIVPEFGQMAMIVLGVSVVTMVFLSQRFKISI